MGIDYRARILNWLTVLASDTGVQLSAVQGLPEELRLTWEDCYSCLDERDASANEVGLAQFNTDERSALSAFNDFIWGLPPEFDAMWHREALSEAPWSQVREKAAHLLSQLQSSD